MKEPHQIDNHNFVQDFNDRLACDLGRAPWMLWSMDILANS